MALGSNRSDLKYLILPQGRIEWVQVNHNEVESGSYKSSGMTQGTAMMREEQTPPLLTSALQPPFGFFVSSIPQPTAPAWPLSAEMPRHQHRSPSSPLESESKSSHFIGDRRIEPKGAIGAFEPHKPPLKTKKRHQPHEKALGPAEGGSRVKTI